MKSSLRCAQSFDEHAQAIATARSLFTAESTAEHVLASGQTGNHRSLAEPRQPSEGHQQNRRYRVRVRANYGSFTQIVPYANAEGFRLARRRDHVHRRGYLANRQRTVRSARPGAPHQPVGTRHAQTEQLSAKLVTVTGSGRQPNSTASEAGRRNPGSTNAATRTKSRNPKTPIKQELP